MLFVVDLPEDTNRISQRQLVEEIRRQGAFEIFRKGQEYGLEVSPHNPLQLTCMTYTPPVTLAITVQIANVTVVHVFLIPPE